MRRTKLLGLMGLISLLAVVVVVVVVFARSTPAPPSPPSPIEQGKELYSAKGCAQCHGAEAEGTAIAPALPGHSAEVIFRQVRTPRGTMPAASTGQLSDEDLDKIAQFLTSLPPTEEHIEPGEMEEAILVQHWMALFAFKAGDLEDAVHHIQHILELGVEEGHEHELEEAIGLAEEGDPHEAEHIVEEMLVGKAQPELSMEMLHLQLAHSSINVGEEADARHHLNHFIAWTLSDMDKSKAQQILELVEAGNMGEAKQAIEELMSGIAHVE